jgi:hypothetical protein
MICSSLRYHLPCTVRLMPSLLHLFLCLSISLGEVRTSFFFGLVQAPYNKVEIWKWRFSQLDPRLPFDATPVWIICSHRTFCTFCWQLGSPHFGPIYQSEVNCTHTLHCRLSQSPPLPRDFVSFSPPPLLFPPNHFPFSPPPPHRCRGFSDRWRGLPRRFLGRWAAAP